NWRNFTVLQRRLGDPDSPGNAFVHAAAPSSLGSGHGLWLAGSGGVLDHLDPESGQLDHRLYEACGSLFIIGVLEARDRSVWLGCQDQLVRFDPAAGSVRRWYADGSDDAAPPGRISQLVQQRDGRLWVASHQAVQVRTPDGRVLDTIMRGDGRGLEATVLIEHMLTAPDGGIWVATSEGLLAWDDGARRFRRVPGAPEAAVYGVALAG